MTGNMWIASLAWAILTLGLFFRRNRRVHVPCMLLAIAMDFSLVLYLQLTREAVQKALSFELVALQQTHIAFSALALVCYIPTLVYGSRLVRGVGNYEQTRARHIRIAVTTYLLRTLGFCFMFSMWKS